ncbi:hypothetical protein EYF80_012094 [Liparis tanakae]|uniref:Uncharacterized protein n=1 Tax=Liparis tanakae TaxID=230148 RepID=A0A4Z2IIM4_9TELE|nr:hypothetical protein EYF80_012094 [Liparis tanakae]
MFPPQSLLPSKASLLELLLSPLLYLALQVLQSPHLQLSSLVGIQLQAAVLISLSPPPKSSYVFFCTPVSLTDELEALLVELLQRLEFVPLLSLPVLPQLLLQLIQLTLPSLLDLSADLQCNGPLLLPHLKHEHNRRTRLANRNELK